MPSPRHASPLISWHKSLLKLAEKYFCGYFLESCRSLEDIEIQVTALCSHPKFRERDDYLSSPQLQVPFTTRKDMQASPIEGYREELVSKVAKRPPGDVS